MVTGDKTSTQKLLDGLSSGILAENSKALLRLSYGSDPTFTVSAKFQVTDFSSVCWISVRYEVGSIVIFVLFARIYLLV